MFLLIEFCHGTPPSCLKVMGGGWVVVVAWSNLVSAQGPLVLGLGLKGFGLRVWGQGLTIYMSYENMFSEEDHIESRLLRHCLCCNCNDFHNNSHLLHR